MTMGSPSGFAVLIVLALLLGLLVVVLKVATSRRAGRDAGVSELDAGAVALAGDAVFEAPGPAAGLRQPPPPAPGPSGSAEPSAPVPRDAADRLRELDELLEQGLIDEQEHGATRQAVLGSL